MRDRGQGVRVVRFEDNPHGCAPYSEMLLDDEAVAVRRGGCTFLEKLVFARKAGASGVVVLGNEDSHINPSTDQADLVAAGEIDDVAIVVLRKTDAKIIALMLDSAEKGLGTVKLVVEPFGGPTETGNQPATQDGDVEGDGNYTESQEPPPTRVLYLNNHPLLNTRLLV